MRNKILLVVIIILLPFSIISHKKEETKSIKVLLNYKDNSLSLDLDDYLIGVLGAEMPASFNMEALKAQAIASRTYALYDMNNNIVNTSIEQQQYIDIDEMHNKWQDSFNDYYNKIKNAVLDTKNIVMIYDGNIIKSYYYAISNGKTEDAKTVFNEDMPYLNIVDSSFDKNVKNYEKTITINKEDFCNTLKIKCNEIIIDNIMKDNTNRINNITINNKIFDGIELRKILNLRSTDFYIEEDNNNIKITTKGYGHGVGMSQYGANYLANNNYNYEDILKYYYTDIELKKLV